MLLSILILAAATLAIFFSAVLVGKKKTTSADRVLSIWLLIVFTQLIIYLIEVHQIKYANIWVEISGALVFLLGPILLLYYKLLSQTTYKKRENFVHFFPFAINLLLIPLLVTAENYFLDITLLVLKIASLLSYNLIILSKLSQHHKKIKWFYSNIENKELQWLKVVVIGLLLTTSIAIVSTFLAEFEIIQIPLDGEFLIPIAASILVFYMGYSGIRQTSIFVDFEDTNEKNLISKKFNNTGLDKKQSAEKFQAIRITILERKLFLEPQLKLSDLAKEMDIPTHHLSQMINQNAGQNFYQFINTFRIDEVIKNIHLDKHKKNTLFAIALDAGFNSKASFNRAFKNIVEMTPTEYITKYEDDKQNTVLNPKFSS